MRAPKVSVCCSYLIVLAIGGEGARLTAGGWVARPPSRGARAERRRGGLAVGSPAAGGWVGAEAHQPSRHAAFSSMEDSWTTNRSGG
jgi:hypothetical protein